jgi:hypothetical protein
MQRRQENPGEGVSSVKLLVLLSGAADAESSSALLRKAGAWEKVFEKLPGNDPRWIEDGERRAELARVFVGWWQDEALLAAPKGTSSRRFVPMLQETKAHHHVLDCVLRAREAMLEYGVGRLPDNYSLPCLTCGRIFESQAPRFARTCGGCQKESPYPQRRRVHATGALPVFAGGFFPKGSQRRQYVYLTVCEHPECVAVFAATHPEKKYCPNHTRVSATRARHRLATPKHKRFRFYPNYSECDEGTEVGYNFIIEGQRRTCIIGPDGYEARDEAEFRPLAYYAATQSVLNIVAASGS